MSSKAVRGGAARGRGPAELRKVSGREDRLEGGRGRGRTGTVRRRATRRR